MPSLHIVKPKKNGSAPAKGSLTKVTAIGSDGERRKLRRLRLAKPQGDGARRRAALRRLGVSAADLKTAPPLSEMVKQCVRGGLTEALEAMRFCGDLSVTAFLEKYDSIPERDRKSLPWEAIALAAEVHPQMLLGGMILAVQAHSASRVKLIALSHHPEMMQKRVEFGRLAGGERDRTAIDTGLGFLPTKTGSTFIINPQSKRDDDDREPEGIDAPESDLDHLFPSLSRTQETLVPRSARQLEAGQ